MRSLYRAGTTLSQLLQQGHLVHAGKGQVIHASDAPSPVMLVKKGYIKRYSIRNDGSQSIQIVYGPGGVFPLTVVFKKLLNQILYDGPETFFYEAMTEADLYMFDVEKLAQAVETVPLLYGDLLEVCGNRLYCFIHAAENQSTHDAYNRIAHQLVFFGRQFGEQTTLGVRIMLPLTHYDLATILNLTRETITAGIIKLRNKKLIQTDRNIIILNFDKLVIEAYS